MYYAPGPPATWLHSATARAGTLRDCSPPKKSATPQLKPEASPKSTDTLLGRPDRGDHRARRHRHPQGDGLVARVGAILAHLVRESIPSAAAVTHRYSPECVEGEFCEILAPERPGTYPHACIFMHHHNM